jgi:hypothetical protein
LPLKQPIGSVIKSAAFRSPDILASTIHAT